jgi:uncharacterized OsmC-like protein/esterase/lipase
MKNELVHFKGHKGNTLAGRISLPADQKPHYFVLFAHCFTCSKNLNAVRNIANGLTSQGYGVLSFDFTGLGESEGDFADENFSSNVEDLVAAANFLEDEYKAPSLLVGHSLGGAAVIKAAVQLEAVKGIATIGAPAEPDHVKKLLLEDLDEIETEGSANVSLGGRPFLVKKQFIEDLNKHSSLEVLSELRKSIIISHSPQDDTVDIENARKLYEKAHHPKSFISLDGANHLLTNKEDSFYVGSMIASWANRYLEKAEEKPLETKSQSVAQVGSEQDGLTTQLLSEGHHLIADEPEDIGGSNLGPSPYGYLTSALAACTALTLRLYANRKKWPLEEVLVHVNHEKRHEEDCTNCEDEASKITFFDREIELKGDLTDEQLKRLLEIADKCPVHKTLESEIKITTKPAG